MYEAMSVWEDRGYESSSMRDIARRLDMSVNELYSFFKNKEEVILSLYDSMNQKSIEAFELVDTGDDDLGQNFSKYLKVIFQNRRI